MFNSSARPSLRFVTLLSLLLPVSLSALACSSDTGADVPGGLGQPSNGSGGTGAPAAGTGGVATAGAGGTDAVGGGGSSAGTRSNMPIPIGPQAGTGGTMSNCGAQSHEAMIKPLAIFMLVDQSASMTQTVNLWEPVTNSVRAFVSDPESAGIEVALGYFPATSESLDEKCDASFYVAPAVEVGVLPGNAAPVTASLDTKIYGLNGAMTPVERLSTPTSAAIAGSLQYFQEWLVQHPDHLGVLVLATDGEPAGCDERSRMAGTPTPPQPAEVGMFGTFVELMAAQDAISAAAMGTPAIQTYVIGIGNLQAELDQLAAVGGTGRDAFIIDAAGGTETQEAFLQAMLEIRGSALPCSFDIPTPTAGELDFNKVNVDFQADRNDPTAPSVPFVKVENAAACADSASAWHYDDPAHPTSIELCPAACSAVRGTMSMISLVSVSLGCETRVL